MLPTTTKPTESIQEVRWYNGVIEGFDTGIVYQANFKTVTYCGTTSCFVEIEGGLREDGKINRWVESNVEWFKKWYPQLIADVLSNPVEGWGFGQEFVDVVTWDENWQPVVNKVKKFSIA
jgi:hypothetical protein